MVENFFANLFTCMGFLAKLNHSKVDLVLQDKMCEMQAILSQPMKLKGRVSASVTDAKGHFAHLDSIQQVTMGWCFAVALE